ncbi:hypothetical protein LCGC14_0679640 [marine sediment metagenome]|uniref:TetR/AcrR family transcriptional regulator n=2 Tax=root TaxID=1 RepID=A0A831VV78_9FLAO|nr:TetR/AcrR family transcriptional regulator [Pricia antarctica]
MSTKAEKTTAFIIETVAPVFNKQGYIATSMSDLTEATGLTKGAIYGNFENKEALALSAYEYHSKLLFSKIDEILGIEGGALDKVYALTDFYRSYDTFTKNMGGCPILNTGVDAEGNNRLLAAANREAIKEIEGKIALVLENGVSNKELKLQVTPLQFAKQMFTIIQGAVAMSTMTRDRKYLINTITYLDVLIKIELKR